MSRKRNNNEIQNLTLNSLYSEKERETALLRDTLLRPAGCKGVAAVGGEGGEGGGGNGGAPRGMGAGTNMAGGEISQKSAHY